MTFVARTKQPTRITQPTKRERREPMQSRSRERMATILDVTARLVDELGPDQVTTTLIAEQAGISVGSVYSYFHDRSSIFDAIVERSIVTLDELVAATRRKVPPGQILEGSHAIVDALAEMYRTEPGFRSLWFSQHLSTTMLATMRRSDDHQAQRLLDLLAANGMYLDRDQPFVAAQIYVGLIDKCFDLAFRNNPDGDQALIDELKHAIGIFFAAYLREGTPPTPPAAASRAGRSKPSHRTASTKKRKTA
ncbi:MAG: TetR family transcriptional regulator [Actinobacteria bacterium]|nr:TetR family transcriptional regulator [Actinomycetota bacterium]